MAKPVVMKPGVGDHPAERCPPYEADMAFGLLRTEMATVRVKAMMLHSLVLAAQVRQ